MLVKRSTQPDKRSTLPPKRSMSTGQTQHLKKSLFVLRPGQSCPLTSTEPAGFSAVLVYSFLIYRLKMKKGIQNQSAVTNKQIQRGTGLCRSRTIPRALQILEEHGLVGLVNNRVFPHQGQSSTWFVQMKHSQHKPWYARFAYFPIWIPAYCPRGLTPRQNALYWLLVFKPLQRQTYYAKCLGIAEKSVSRAVEKLRALELLSWARLQPLERQDRHLALWQAQTQKKVTNKEFRLSQTGLFARITEKSPFVWFTADEKRKVSGYERFAEQIDGYGNRMRAAGYSTVELGEFWDQTAKQIMLEANSMEPLELYVREFGKLFSHVEATTLRNRAAGLFSGSNSLGLLKTVTRRATEQLKVVWENHRTYGGLCIWSWSSDP